MIEADQLATYFGEPHPEINHNVDCKLCPLGRRFENLSVAGAGPKDLSKVRLIIISDHPGYYEVNNGYPLYDNEQDRMPSKAKKGHRKNLADWRNAGNYLRYMLNSLFNLDTYEDTWSTNACKCDRRDSSILESTHLKPCVTQWLSQEFNVLDQYVPSVPILIAGRHAYKSLSILDKSFKAGAPTSLNDARRRTDLYYNNHPVVVTVNPASICRLVLRIENNVGPLLNKKREVKSASFWSPYLPGTPETIFRDDLLCLKPYL